MTKVYTGTGDGSFLRSMLGEVGVGGRSSAGKSYVCAGGAWRGRAALSPMKPYVRVGQTRVVAWRSR